MKTKILFFLLLFFIPVIGFAAINNGFGAMNNIGPDGKPIPKTAPDTQGQGAWGQVGSWFNNIGDQFAEHAKETFVPYTAGSPGLLTPVKTDVSLNYLGFIFGNVDGVLQGAGSQVIGRMFSVYNTAILSLGGIILMYILIVSTLNTAHEGEIMGKKWSSIWIPVRSALGVGLLVPKASGYSVIQIFMMWIVVQGIGAANSVWNAATDYLQAGGVLVARVAPFNGGTSTGFKNAPLASALLRSLVCLYIAEDAVNARIAEMRKIEKDPKKQYLPVNYVGDVLKAISREMSVRPRDAGVAVKEIPIPATAEGVTDENRQWYNLTDGICGKVTISENDVGNLGKLDLAMSGYSYDQLMAIINARFIAVSEMITQLAPTAKQLAAAIRKESGKSPAERIPLENYVGTEAIRSAASTYAMLVQPAMNAFNTPIGLVNEIGKIRADGWLMAGSYLDEITRTNISILATDPRPPGVEEYMTKMEALKNELMKSEIGIPREQVDSYLGQGISPLFDYVNRNSKLEDFSDRARAIKPPIPAGIAGGIGLFAGLLPYNLGTGVNALVKTMDYPVRLLFEGINQILASQANVSPLTVIGGLGVFIFSATENLVVGLIGLAVTAGLIGLAPFVTVSNAITVLSQWLVPVLMPVFYAIWGFAAIMAFYVPLVPYLLFTLVSLGWFFAVIEAMVAAPLVALGLVHPEGHEAFGRAEASIMMIVHVFLKPTLIILGFIFGIIMSWVALWLLNRGFSYVYFKIIFSPERLVLAKLGGGLATGVLALFFALLIFVGMYAVTALLVVQKSFELIHIIPTRVMAWIGHQGADYGLHQGMGEIKGGSEGAMKEAGNVGRAAQEAISKKAAQAAEKDKGPGGIQKTSKPETPSDKGGNTPADAGNSGPPPVA